MSSRDQRGFSLIELAVVVTLAGLVLAFVTPSINRYLKKAKLRDAAGTFASEMRLARQKAVTNNGRFWFWTANGLNYYYTGEQRWLGGTTYASSPTWTGPKFLPSNVRVLSPNWGGWNYFIYYPNGRPVSPASTPTNIIYVSGSVKLVSTQGDPDTATVNVDLSGSVWK